MPDFPPLGLAGSVTCAFFLPLRAPEEPPFPPVVFPRGRGRAPGVVYCSVVRIGPAVSPHRPGGDAADANTSRAERISLCVLLGVLDTPGI